MLYGLQFDHVMHVQRCHMDVLPGCHKSLARVRYQCNIESVCNCNIIYNLQREQPLSNYKLRIKQIEIQENNRGIVHSNLCTMTP
jgi:hypothetical protein